MKHLISIDEVCRMANCSRPTVYRRLKTTNFPKPKKVDATEAKGPRTINRWDHDEVTAWLLNGGDPVWLKQLEIAALAAAITEKALQPTTLGAWYTKHQIVLNAIIGGTLAGIAVSIFGGQ